MQLLGKGAIASATVERGTMKTWRTHKHRETGPTGTAMPFLTTSDGCRIWHFTQGSGTRVCFVPHPVHGFGSAYQPLVDGLANRFEILIHHTRNTGRSGDSPSCAVSVDRLATDIEDIRLHYGLDQMVLMAHSAAGFAAIRYASRWPNHVRGVLLLSSTNDLAGAQHVTGSYLHANAGKPDVRSTVASLLSESSATTSRRMLEQTIIRFVSLDKAVEFARNHAIPDALNISHYNAEKLSATETDNTTPAFARLTTPTTLVLGDAETGGFADGAVVDAFLLPDSTKICRIPNAGHFTWIENPNAIEVIAAAALQLAGPHR